MESVSDTIYALYRGTPFHGEWIVACLDGAWHGLLGDRLASTCRPIAMCGGVLVVEVLEMAWFPVLSDMNQELLQPIRRATGGEVREISFKR